MNGQSVLIINSRYALLGSPYSGGMADVYQAVDLQAGGSKVAVKVFRHGCIEEEILAESFKRETQALKELTHPKIVELLDSGIDPGIGHYFLVMPWVERNLTALLQESPPQGWDDFWEIIGKPILEALEFSHERGYIHRDLKPSNILVDSNNQIKLADFGISKIKSYFQPSITLAEFTSRPYTPPEYDDGSYTYTRDVFGFGVIVLRCLTNVDLADYSSIPKALDQLDIPPKISEIIEAAVATDPAERPRNAEVLLAQLQAVQDQRQQAYSSKKRVCYLKLSQRAITNFQNELNLSQAEIEKILQEDLNTICGITPFQNRKATNPEEEFSEGHYSIFGAAYSYHAATDQSHLLIINAKSLPNSALEGKRESSWNPDYQFEFSKPLNLPDAIEVIQDLKFAVADYEATQKQVKAEAAKQRLFRVWSDILRAKADWEKERETPLRYTSVEYDGSRAYFRLASLPDEDITGQPRHITRENGSSILRGDVEEVTDEQLVLYIQYGNPEQIPDEGELRFDTRAAEIALYRQKSALDAIRFDRAVRTNLRSLLINPSETQPPKSKEITHFFQKLNPSQAEAVQAALGTEDFLIVEGPPGTGKTRFITEVILQTLEENPHARILLSSQTHVALDNALERIRSQNPHLKLVRIGSHEKVADVVKPLLVEEQMHQWRQEAISNSQTFLEAWAAQHSISAEDVQLATQLQELKSITLKLDLLREELNHRQQERDNLFPFSSEHPQKRAKYELPEELEEQIRQLDEEIADFKRKLKQVRDEKELVAERLQNLSGKNIKKFLKLTVKELDTRLEQLIDLRNPEAKKLQQLLELQAEWFDQFGRSSEFNASLLKRVQVVAGTCIGMPKDVQDIEFDLCIVDEASKATATEVLVPISRSRRWILVGDSNQLPPFQDEASSSAQFLSKYDLKPDDVQETLFDLLLRTLPETSRKSLAIQHRMVEPIGNLISQCFYDGRLQSSGPAISQNLSRILPKSVTWLTTASLPNRTEQNTRPSYNNACEVSIILQFLKKLNQIAIEVSDNVEKCKVAILTGYTAQRKLLNRRLDSELENLQSLDIECNTVDAFQGREADIAIYSITRSNPKGELGFLNKKERLNVALSRGKIGLVIVGDHHFCLTAPSNPLARVLDHIEHHSNGCCLKETEV